MELGKLQKAWVESLRKHPERQTPNTLGFKENNNSYRACCLGELLCVSYKIKKKKMPFNEDGLLEEKGGSNISLFESFIDFGLKNSTGGFFDSTVYYKNRTFISLAEMNDGGLTWPEIADFVENNPELVFVKSV